MYFDQYCYSRVWMGSACSSCSAVVRSDNQCFVLYVPTVGYCVCCDISAGLIRPADLYATCYMGLFFDIHISTHLISILHCPITPISLQAVYIYVVTFRQF